jgi:hypothetical protein
MPQKSVSDVCSSTTLAKLSAPSPVILFLHTLRHTEAHKQRQWVLMV